MNESHAITEDSFLTRTKETFNHVSCNDMQTAEKRLKSFGVKIVRKELVPKQEEYKESYR